jgi:hypothetical protein
MKTFARSHNRYDLAVFVSQAMGVMLNQAETATNAGNPERIDRHPCSIDSKVKKVIIPSARQIDIGFLYEVDQQF